jgi:hypothetical protein
MDQSLYDVLVFIGAFFLVILAIEWVFLPFAIFGIKGKLAELISATDETNAAIAKLIVETEKTNLAVASLATEIRAANPGNHGSAPE